MQQIKPPLKTVLGLSWSEEEHAEYMKKLTLLQLLWLAVCVIPLGILLSLLPRPRN